VRHRQRWISSKNTIFPIDDIETIKVDTYGIGVIAVGKGVPENGTFALHSSHCPTWWRYASWTGGFGPAQLTEKRIADKAVIALSKKVTVTMDDELNRIYPEKTSSRVSIRLKDGKTLIKQVDILKAILGLPLLPLIYRISSGSLPGQGIRQPSSGSSRW